ncbi:MAG: F0F1 ATP synthase subunit gamma [Oscillospiraceae bacterium]|jgi:F0F1-type ATP synthase gamma subunit|nr:F0F1 ATP synthase subunit gamma [Oscillospiraceae bacterium]
MRIKTIVKVMNFHSLLHVDSARRISEKYIRMESEVSKIIDLIINNRNFILDKLALKVDDMQPELNIYIGSDYAFCGSMNAVVNAAIAEDEDAEKIIVGKKLKRNAPNTALVLTRDGFNDAYEEVEAILVDSLSEMKHSSINVVYNHYYYSGRIGFRRKKIFPIVLSGEAENFYTEDFSVEGQTEELLRALCASFVGYELKIAATNSFAAENIMRQNATTESLKKIEEREAEDSVLEAKQKKQVSFRRVLDSFVKKSFYGGEAVE